MFDCAFCGSPDAEMTTTEFEERQRGVSIRVEGVPAIRCRVCEEGREPAVTIGMAKAVQAAVQLIFDEAPISERMLTATVSTEAAR
jgi:YgiT-type zinc finger domain-containing protein